jgi:hypothetical protein
MRGVPSRPFDPWVVLGVSGDAEAIFRRSRIGPGGPGLLIPLGLRAIRFTQAGGWGSERDFSATSNATMIRQEDRDRLLLEVENSFLPQRLSLSRFDRQMGWSTIGVEFPYPPYLIRAIAAPGSLRTAWFTQVGESTSEYNLSIGAWEYRRPSFAFLFFDRDGALLGKQSVVPELVTRDSLPTLYASVAVAADGRVCLVWSDGVRGIQSALVSPASVGPVTTLEQAAPSQIPAVIVDPFGNLTAVWTTVGGTYASRSQNGSAWGAPARIGVRADSDISVAADAAGNLLASWATMGDDKDHTVEIQLARFRVPN